MTRLDLNPTAEAQELHAVLTDIRELLMLRMKRRDVSPTRVVVIGKLLNHIDEIEAVNCPHVHDTQEAASEAPVGA